MRFGRLGRFFQSKFNLLLFAQQIAPVAFYTSRGRPTRWDVGYARNRCRIANRPLCSIVTTPADTLGIFREMGNFLAMMFFFCLCAVRQNYKVI